MINPWMIAGGFAAFVGVFGAGVATGINIESGNCDGRLLRQMQTSSSIVSIKEGEVEQCRAQVDKINRTVAEQGTKLNAALRRDQRAREKAAEAAAAAQRRRDESLERVNTILVDIGARIDDGTLGICAGERVPDELVSLLNDALAATGDGAGSEGGVPTADSGD